MVETVSPSSSPMTLLPHNILHNSPGRPWGWPRNTSPSPSYRDMQETQRDRMDRKGRLWADGSPPARHSIEVGRRVLLTCHGRDSHLL